MRETEHKGPQAAGDTIKWTLRLVVNYLRKEGKPAIEGDLTKYFSKG